MNRRLLVLSTLALMAGCSHPAPPPAAAPVASAPAVAPVPSAPAPTLPRSWAYGLTPSESPAAPSDASRAAIPMIQTAVKDIRGAHKGDYTDVAESTIATLPWGALTTFPGSRYPGVGSKGFGLHVDNVPTNDCMTFVRAASPGFHDIWVGDKDPQATGATVFNSGHLDLSMLSRACHARASVGIDFLTH